MALRCDNCGKGVMYGHNVSHAKNRTRKIFKPNLHSARVVVGGMRKKLKLCTKCLRMARNVQKQVKVEEVKTPEATTEAPKAPLN